MRTTTTRALIAVPAAAVITFGGYTTVFAIDAPATDQAPAPSSAYATSASNAPGAREQAPAWSWEEYFSGGFVSVQDLFTEINHQRELVGVPPVLYNTRLEAVAEVAAGDVAGRERGADTPAAPEGGIHRGQVQSSRTFFEEELQGASASEGFLQKVLDPRVTHVGIGQASPPEPVDETEEGWVLWSEHFVVDLWEYPAGVRVSGSSRFASEVLRPEHYFAPYASPFSDVRTTQKFYTEMAWSKDYGVSTGWTDGTYRPLRPINRDAMAAFLYRLAGEPRYTAPDTSPFADVSTTQKYYKEMAWLADQEISTGWQEEDGSRTYRPLQPIYRDAMAAFLYRLAGSPEFEAPSASPFGDVTTEQDFYDEMAWLADQEISTGWQEEDGSRTYRPLRPINRDAMAAFLFRLQPHL